MATINSQRLVPTGLKFTKIESTGYTIYKNAIVTPEDTEFFLSWLSKSKTFQIQWRSRGRLAPAAAALVDSTGADVWQDWSDWQGSDLSTDTYYSLGSEIEALSEDMKVLISEPFEFEFDYSQVDAYQYEFRVRGYDTYTAEASEWGFLSCYVFFEPQIQISATPTSDGLAEINITSDWQRGYNSFAFFRNQKTIAQGIQLADDFSLSLTDRSAILDDQLNYSRYLGYTTDNVSLSVLNGNYFIDLEPYQPQDPPALPTLEVNANIDEIVVTFEGTYDSASAWIEWQDVENFSANFEVIKNGTNWELTLPQPPLDVEISISVSVVLNGKWAIAQAQAYVNSQGRFVFGNSEQSFVFRLDPVISITHAPAVEIVETANNYVSRFGNTTKTTLDFSCSVVKNFEIQPKDLSALYQPRNWVFRGPNGFRKNVALTKIALSEPIGQSRSLSMQMTEVL